MDWIWSYNFIHVARRCQTVSDSGARCKRTEELYPKWLQFLYSNNFNILILILRKQPFVSKDADLIDIRISQCKLQILKK
jgi:hypothetical protein